MLSKTHRHCLGRVELVVLEASAGQRMIPVCGHQNNPSVNPCRDTYVQISPAGSTPVFLSRWDDDFDFRAHRPAYSVQCPTLSSYLPGDSSRKSYSPARIRANVVLPVPPAPRIITPRFPLVPSPRNQVLTASRRRRISVLFSQSHCVISAGSSNERHRILLFPFLALFAIETGFVQLSFDGKHPC